MIEKLNQGFALFSQYLTAYFKLRGYLDSPDYCESITDQQIVAKFKKTLLDSRYVFPLLPKNQQQFQILSRFASRLELILAKFVKKQQIKRSKAFTSLFQALHRTSQLNSQLMGNLIQNFFRQSLLQFQKEKISPIIIQTVKCKRRTVVFNQTNRQQIKLIKKGCKKINHLKKYQAEKLLAKNIKQKNTQSIKTVAQSIQNKFCMEFKSQRQLQNCTSVQQRFNNYRLSDYSKQCRSQRQTTRKSNTVIVSVEQKRRPNRVVKQFSLPDQHRNLCKLSLCNLQINDLRLTKPKVKKSNAVQNRKNASFNSRKSASLQNQPFQHNKEQALTNSCVIIKKYQVKHSAEQKADSRLFRKAVTRRLKPQLRLVASQSKSLEKEQLVIQTGMSVQQKISPIHDRKWLYPIYRLLRLGDIE